MCWTHLAYLSSLSIISLAVSLTTSGRYSASIACTCRNGSGSSHGRLSDSVKPSGFHSILHRIYHTNIIVLIGSMESCCFFSQATVAWLWRLCSMIKNAPIKSHKQRRGVKSWVHYDRPAMHQCSSCTDSVAKGLVRLMITRMLQLFITKELEAPNSEPKKRPGGSGTP